MCYSFLIIASECITASVCVCVCVCGHVYVCILPDPSFILLWFLWSYEELLSLPLLSLHMCLMPYILPVSVCSFSSNTYTVFILFKSSVVPSSSTLMGNLTTIQDMGLNWVNIDFKLDYLSEITSKAILLCSVFQALFNQVFSLRGRV